MESIFYEKLENWFLGALSNLKIDDNAQDIHIDEIYGGKFKNLNKKEVFELSYSIFSSLCKYIHRNHIDISGNCLWLYIDLISELNVLAGKPESFEQILEQIDLYSPPEIILTNLYNSNEIPLTELYRVPIHLNHTNQNEHINIFYREYRSYEDMLKNNSYTRLIDICFKQ